MKKKIVHIIFFLLLTLGILLIFNKTEIIEKTKKIIQKTQQISNNENTITTIDITNLDSNITIEHEHILVTKYDTNQHWEECKICNEAINKKIHEFKDNWSMENPDYCHEENINRKTCICGYSYETSAGRINHSYYELNQLALECTRSKECSVCRKTLLIHRCMDSNRKYLVCNHWGTCTKCGYSYGRYNCQHGCQATINDVRKNIKMFKV